MKSSPKVLCLERGVYQWIAGGEAEEALNIQRRGTHDKINHLTRLWTLLLCWEIPWFKRRCF